MKPANRSKSTGRPQEPTTAEVVKGMVSHYHATGTYRPEDVRRVLGDPTGGVHIGSTPSAELGYRRTHR